MGVQDAAFEFVHSFKERYIRCREVTVSDDHVIKSFFNLFVVDEVMCRYGEFVLVLMIVNVSDRVTKPAPFTYTGFFNTSLYIVCKNFPRGKTCDRFAKVLVERVICKLETFFRAVGPQITVHRAMYRFAVFIKTRTPGIVPQAAPVLLFFKTNYFGNIFTILLCRLECPQGCSAAWSGPDDCYTL